MEKFRLWHSNLFRMMLHEKDISNYTDMWLILLLLLSSLRYSISVSSVVWQQDEGSMHAFSMIENRESLQNSVIPEKLDLWYLIRVIMIDSTSQLNERCWSRVSTPLILLTTTWTQLFIYIVLIFRSYSFKHLIVKMMLLRQRQWIIKSLKQERESAANHLLKVRSRFDRKTPAKTATSAKNHNWVWILNIGLNQR